MPSLLCNWAVKNSTCVSWFEACPGHTKFTENVRSMLQAPRPPTQVTDDWLEPCTWFISHRQLSQSDSTSQAFLTRELRCSFLQWQEQPCVPKGWRAADRGEKGKRITYRVRRAIWSDETISPWFMRDAAGNSNSWLSGPRRLPGGLAVLPALLVCGILLIKLT